MCVCVALLAEAEAVDVFVQAEVCVLPGLHGGLLTLQREVEEEEDINRVSRMHGP